MLFDKFAVLVEGAFFQPLVKLGRWDGKVRFFSKEGKIYTRLLDEVCVYLEAWGYEIELHDQRRAVQPITLRIDDEWFLRKPEHKLGVKLRPYQVNAVNAALDATSGFIIAGTGAGKCVDGNTLVNIKCGKLLAEKIRGHSKALIEKLPIRH